MLIGIPTPDLLPELLACAQEHANGKCGEGLEFVHQTIRVLRTQRDSAVSERESMRRDYDRLIDAVADGYIVKSIASVEAVYSRFDPLGKKP